MERATYTRRMARNGAPRLPVPSGLFSCHTHPADLAIGRYAGRVTRRRPSAWELACHVLPTTVFAAQMLFALSVSTRYRLSHTVPSGTQGARPTHDHDRRNAVKEQLSSQLHDRSKLVCHPPFQFVN